MFGYVFPIEIDLIIQCSLYQQKDVDDEIKGKNFFNFEKAQSFEKLTDFFKSLNLLYTVLAC